MMIPSWITLLIAGMVILFGLYRLYLGATSAPETLAQRKGLYGGMSPRRHLLYGAVYLLMGGFLIASALGYHPFS